jgi:hypothetical protein
MDNSARTSYVFDPSLLILPIIFKCLIRQKPSSWMTELSLLNYLPGFALTYDA